MKNIKYFFALVALGLTFQSCEDDEAVNTDSIDADTTITTVNATLTTTRDFSAEEEELFFTVALDQTFATDASVVVRLELDDARFTTTSVAIPAGASSVDDSIFLPADDGNDNDVFTPKEDFVAASVTGILVSEATPGVQYNIASNVVLIDLYDALPENVEGGGVSYTFTWATRTSDDYDVTSTGGVLNSETGAPVESASVTNAGLADGTTTLNYVPFAVAEMVEIAYIAQFRVGNEDGTGEIVTYTGTLDATGTDSSLAIPFASITKSTVGENVSYSFMQLED